MSAQEPAFALEPALEDAAAAELLERYGLAGAGDATAEREAVVASPATGEPLARVAIASAEGLARTVRGARKTYDRQWRKLSPERRARHLYAFATLAEDAARVLAVTATLETGRPIRATREDEAAGVARTLFHHAGWADKLEWTLRPGERARPHGVVLVAVGCDAPLAAAAARLAPALACGNAVVLVPDARAPLGAHALALLAARAGLPPGVVSVAPGDAATLEAIATADVDCVAFAGPAAAGRELRRALAGTHRPATYALGGTHAIVVFEDAPLDEAVPAILEAALGGGTPAAPLGARLLVAERIAAELHERLAEGLARLRTGDPLDRLTDAGPVGSAERLAGLRELVRGAIASGARATSARPPAAPAGGFWLEPTLLWDAGPASDAARAELGGPVLVASTFRTPAEGVERANAVPRPLAATVWTVDGALAAYAARTLAAGVVWTGGHVADPALPGAGAAGAGAALAGGIARLRSYLAT